MLAVRNAIAQLQAGAQELDLTNQGIGDAEAAALATVLATNTTLKKLVLSGNRIGPVGARALAAALRNNATLTTLILWNNAIGAKAHGRSRRPSTTTRRSRAWSLAPTTSALKARGRSLRPWTRIACCST